MDRYAKATLQSIGQQYDYMDDSWPDMQEEMIGALMDQHMLSEASAERYVEEFFRHPEWFY